MPHKCIGYPFKMELSLSWLPHFFVQIPDIECRNVPTEALNQSCERERERNGPHYIVPWYCVIYIYIYILPLQRNYFDPDHKIEFTLSAPRLSFFRICPCASIGLIEYLLKYFNYLFINEPEH